MPAQQGKSGFSFAAAARSHAQDETNYGMEFINLPGGINGGIAKLIDARLGVYKSGNNEGKRYIYLAGAIVEPRTATDVKWTWVPKQGGKKEEGHAQVVSQKEVVIEGQRTSQTLPIEETKKNDNTTVSGEENVERALNELRKLGGDECTEALADVKTDAEALAVLEGILKVLKDSAVPPNSPIYFKFSTSDGKPSGKYQNSMVFERWYGVRDVPKDYSPPEDDGVTDNTTRPPAHKNGQANSNPVPAAGTFNEFANPTAGDEPDLDDLAARAADEEGAENELRRLASENGINEDLVDQANSWAEVATMIRKAQDGSGEAPAEEQEEPAAEPAKGEVWLYKPIDPKTKKPMKKAVEVEVKSVDRKKRTAEVLNNTDRKTTWKGVSFDDLEATSS